jgi:hypothetical protein|nr:MAG TPA: hypothetical protein [Caudoviricetes sp.]
MNTAEFSAEFDLLYNNIMSNIAPGLTEYEKSVFLTQAQEQLIIEIYNGQYNGDSFEQSEEVRAYLRTILKTLFLKTASIDSEFPDSYHHYKVELDTNGLWFIIFESARFAGEDTCTKNRKVVVKPVPYDEYWAICRNPFKGPNDNRIIRIDRSKSELELVSDYPLDQYIVKYLSRPAPIVLEQLEGITINGVDTQSECELPDVLHRSILERAVQLAKSAWGQTQEQQ